MNSTADFQGQMDSSSVIGQRAIRTVLTMWGNKANSSPAVEQEQKETLRRFLAGKAGPVEKERKQSTGILDMKPSSFDSRHDEPAEGRSPKDKAKRWSMLKKVLSKETVNEEHDSDIDASSETGNSNLSHLILDNRHAKVVCRQFGNNPKEIMVVEKEDKIPSPEDRNHVVIKVQASTVTLEDCLLRRGMDFDLVAPTPLPLVPGHDVVGRIVAVGLDVTDFKEGDRVAALIRTGGNARYASVPASSLVRVPMSLDAAEASCMVTVYSHAYRCLKAVSSDGPMFSLKGKKILIIGGMDGVGQALTQMCNKARADIWATAPKRRHAYVRGILGATPLPEPSSEWLHDYKETFDIVFDGVCNDALDAAKKAVKPGGKVVCFGYSSLLREDMGVLGAPMSGYFSRLVSQTTASNIDVWEFAQRDPETYKKNLYSLFQLLKWNKLRPHIAKRVSLTEVSFAHSKLESGEVRGVVVCLPWKRVPHPSHLKDVIELGRE